MMNKKYYQITSVLLASLLSLSLLTACGGEEGNSTPTDPAATQGSQITPNDTEAETEAETESTVLDEASAKALLTEAIAASQGKTMYEHTIHGTAGMNGVNMLDMTYRTATDGTNQFLAVESSDLMDVSYTFVGDKVYHTRKALDAEEKYVVTVTEEQKQALIAAGISAEVMDLSVMMSVEAYVGLAGERQDDGSVILTASDVSDAVKAAMGGDPSMVVTLQTCQLTLSADGLLTGIELAYNITLPETDFAAGMSMDTTVSRTTVYDQGEITAPADAAAHVEESYAAVFEGSMPLNSLLAAAKMPLDADDYMINTITPTGDLTAQGLLLTSFPHLYADKSFTITTTVMYDNFMHFAPVGDALPALEFSADIFAPLDGDQITFTGTFKCDNGADETLLDSYAIYIDSYELLERAKGPNGGTYMFVNVNSSLNVRTEPTTAGNTPIHSFLRGELVEVLEIVDGWAKITFEDTPAGYAYVSAEYLAEK